MNMKSILYTVFIFSFSLTLHADQSELISKKNENQRVIPKYKIRKIDISGSGFRPLSIAGINNKGQVYGRAERVEKYLHCISQRAAYDEESDDSFRNELNEDAIYYTDENNKCQIIDDLHSIDGASIFMNDIGQILVDTYNSMDFWDPSLGLVEFPLALDPAVINGFNNFGEAVGFYTTPYRSASFVWHNGEYDENINNLIRKQAKKFGEETADVYFYQTNNLQELCGCVTIDEKHKDFFWDGTLHLLPDLNLGRNWHCIRMNDNGTILFSKNNITYLLNKSGEMTEIKNFRGYEMNNYGTILGYQIFPENKKRVPAIWQNGEIYTIAELLGIVEFPEIEVDRLDLFSRKSCLDINDKGQIVCNLNGISILEPADR